MFVLYYNVIISTNCSHKKVTFWGIDIS